MTRDAVLLLIVGGGALFVRAWLPFTRIFRDGYVSFQGDAWYHMRAVDHLVRNFPSRLTLDPYAAPGGQYVGVAPLFDYLVSATALALGLGSPSTALVECVGAFLPALLGTASTVLVFLLGRRLFEPRAGLFAAALLAIMPGHFLDRTMLGVADHHAAETTLVLSTLLLVVIAVQALTGTPGARAWERRAAPWLAGASLGAYCLTWTSAAMFVFGLGAWVAVQFTLDQIRGRATSYLTVTAARVGITALAIVLAFQNPAMFRYGSQVVTLAALILLAGTLQGVETVRARLQVRRAALAASAAGLAAAAAAFAAWLFPDVVAGLVRDVARLQPNTTARTVTETQPLLFMNGRFSLLHPWAIFRTTFYLGVPALAALSLRAWRRAAPADSLLLTWGALVFAATLGQNRFGYYLSPLLAVLAGWTCSSLLAWTGLPAPVAAAPAVSPPPKTPVTPPRSWRADLAVVIVAALIFYPSLRPGIASVERDEGLPAAWNNALGWLRDHTPEPFGEADYYFARYDRSDRRQAAYTVMNWWDYGYWIMRVGRRVPVSNPTQSGAPEAARFFTATDEAAATAMLDGLSARYVIVDRDLVFISPPNLPALLGKFGSVVEWAGEQPSRFYEPMFERTPDGRIAPAWVFHPDYYRSMGARLYLFGTAAVQPEHSTWVISYADRTTQDGRRLREIVRSERFATYAEAHAQLERLGSGPHRLVGRDPLRSCVPLPEMTGLRVAHDEPALPGAPPLVRIVEKLPQ